MFNKIKKIKAFTILELTIVIVIIGVLMAATMKFGGDRIGLLNNKNIQEQFLDNYSSLQSKNNMTNYHMGKIYQNLDIKLNVGENYFNYQYNYYDSFYTGRTYVEGGNYKINKITLDGKDAQSANISMIPYTLGCIIENNSNELKIGILANDQKQYCFSIKSDNCRIRNISCNY